MLACGLDFGTSNSAIGVAHGADATLVRVEGDSDLIPSAVFFDQETGGVLFGAHAIATYIGQAEGRLLRALKTILGSPLIDEKTAIGSRRVALTEVVSLFIQHLKSRAEHFARGEITAVVHGRPVHFADGDPAADRKAEAVLESIARAAGFREVSFVYEPIAAALHYEESATREELVLVADIGGGTSDFSLIRVGPGRHNRPDRSSDILANSGGRIGGTDFDTLLSLASVMPLLGLGSHLIDKNLPMPRGPYQELATWALINFLYNQKTEREIATLVRQAREPERVQRLLRVIRARLGHRLAFAVEDAKIALSDSDETILPLGFIEPALAAPASRTTFAEAVAEKRVGLHKLASACIADAGVRPDAVNTIFFTGGSCRIPAVRAAIAAAAPAAQAAQKSDMLSVGLGLTREAARRYA